jgi:aspartate carbamoyltransferase catalytic subunit
MSEPEARGGTTVDWKQKHLLGLEDYSAEEITCVLDAAEEFREIVARNDGPRDDLRGKVVVNLFFEPSTRTRTSFELAERRLGATVINFDVATSSVVKDETLRDTARNIEAMGIDAAVMRHGCSGAPQLLARAIAASVINAGDGQHEHPTQGLLDIFTIRRRLGRVAGLKVAIVGDIRHSRVARSNIWGLTKLGAEVRLVAPRTLLPVEVERMGARVVTDPEAGLRGVDVIYLLRLQLERQKGGFLPSLREYALTFGLDARRARWAADDALIMHPGPMNRGVEIQPEIADGPHSVILEQVANGVAVRMAALYLVSGGQPPEPVSPVEPVLVAPHPAGR